LNIRPLFYLLCPSSLADHGFKNPVGFSL